MADDKRDDDNRADEGLAPERRLEKVLESRWDPGKLSGFLKASAGSRGQKLESGHRGRFEKRFGVNLGDVRIFTGELAEEITKAHGAEALTVGDTGMIIMRQSTKFSQGSAAHTALLAHELTHVAQAKPEAMARKTVTAQQGQMEASEEEAEHHEAEVMAEELGIPQLKPSEGDKDAAERGKKEQLLALVVKIMEEENFISPLRSGSR
jgi:hypothetical protein